VLALPLTYAPEPVEKGHLINLIEGNSPLLDAAACQRKQGIDQLLAGMPYQAMVIPSAGPIVYWPSL
jgi:hypothetical protein